MRNKYPEHIDQIDDFYQSQLKDVEILPQADLWDKISATYEKEQSQRKGGFVTFVDKNKTTLLILLVLLLSFAGTYLAFFQKEQQEDIQNNSPLHENIQDLSSPTSKSDDDQSLEVNNKDLSKQVPRVETKKSLDNPSTNKVVDKTSDTELNEENTITSTPTPPVKEETTEAIEASPALETVKPKEKVKFKDKYKKEYQDSTRNLFVPGK